MHNGLEICIYLFIYLNLLQLRTDVFICGIVFIKKSTYSIFMFVNTNRNKSFVNLYLIIFSVQTISFVTDSRIT